MRVMRVIWVSKDNTYRIIEKSDQSYNLEDLKGDMYNPKHNPSISASKLLKEEKEFEALVEIYGVYGYQLEVWNPRPDTGWTYVDSCWGFVGEYNSKNPKYNHYIVEEFIKQSTRSIISPKKSTKGQH